MAASPLKVRVSGEDVLMYALACLAVSTSAIEPSRVQSARKNTAWIGFVRLPMGTTSPCVVGTTGDTTSRTDTKPAAESLRNGRSTPDAAKLSPSDNWAVAGTAAIVKRDTTSSATFNPTSFLIAPLPPLRM